MMKTLRSTSLVLLYIVVAAFASGCSRADSGAAEPAALAPAPAAATASAAVEPASPAAASPAGQHGDGVAATSLDSQCLRARNALAPCAEASTCDEDIAMFLPAASRDALIALEKRPGYSSDAFDAYCLKACQTRSAAVDEAAFARDVCGPGTSTGGAAAGQAPNDQAADPAKPQAVVSFVLHKKLDAPASQTLPLDNVVSILGQPEAKRTTPYECDSAFEEGTIQLYSYPDADIETDGHMAIVRRVKLTGGNAIKLSGGSLLDANTTRDDLQRLIGHLEHGTQSERVSAQPDGSLESSYDFHFNALGRLVSVDYWIGC